ncbi:MAG: cupin domain-containing protein [Sediminispirochaetaceae bacterium]
MIIRERDIKEFDFHGLKIREYLAGSGEKSSFSVIEVPAGASHQLSWSKRSDKYYYIVEGSIEFTMDGQTSIFDKGDLCIVRQGEKFMYANNSDTQATLVLVHTPSFLITEEVFE